MTTLIALAPADGPVAAVAGAPPLDGAALMRDQAAETWLLRGADGRDLAHGSIWWRETPALSGRRTGVIGHYAAADGAASRRLLDHLCGRLASEGCVVAVGPMDGTTWRKYRLAVERSADPPFFLDIETPTEWPGYFRDAGFSPIAEYYSSLVEDLSVSDMRVDRAAARLAASGVRIRRLDPGRLDDELGALHGLSLVAFERAFLYSPIDLPEFLAMYRPVMPLVDPRLVLLAEHAGRLVGYVFAVPDMKERARGHAVTTLVVKTLAVRPERPYAGLGAVLLAEVHRNALGLGLRRAVHALMHASNKSRTLSGHWHAREICRYELLARELAP